MKKTTTILYYVHDPMCSWCWAFRPTMLQLRRNLPAQVRWQNVSGGLAPDTDEPMPEQTRQMVQGHWRNIQATVGTEFNFDFWTECKPRRDTYKACRAVLAASRQQAEDAMIMAIQEAYYLRAMNPSEPDTLCELAGELGLDKTVFENDLKSEMVETEFRHQLALRDRLGVRSFPSLLLVHESKRVRIKHDYHDYRTMLGEIEAGLGL